MVKQRIDNKANLFLSLITCLIGVELFKRGKFPEIQYYFELVIELYLFLACLNVHGEMARRLQVDVCGGQGSCPLTQIETGCDRAQTVIAVTFIRFKCVLVQDRNLKQKEINCIGGHSSSFGQGYKLSVIAINQANTTTILPMHAFCD